MSERKKKSLRPMFLAPLPVLIIGLILAGCSIGDPPDPSPTARAIIPTAAPTGSIRATSPTPEAQLTATAPAATPTANPTTATAVTPTEAPETPAPASEMTLEQACQVTDAVQLDFGGDQDWSHATNLIVYDKIDDDGVYQLHISQPDGSDLRCLSCAPSAGAPSVDVHKFHPAWHPSGDYFVVQVEKEDHPARVGHTEDLVSELLLNGLWNDLYIVSADGSRWRRLTDTQTNMTDGVLAPVFSPDGNQLMWSRLIEEASDEHPWGVWRLMLAEVVFDGDVPRLENMRDITPEGAEFVESHAFSPDGETVLVTADLESRGMWNQNIWSIDLDTGNLQNLTSNRFWNEHAMFAPDGEKVVYMSGEPYPLTFLKTDLMLKDLSEGANLQLTHFNVEGYPEHTPEQSMTLRPRWNADGTKISLTQQMADSYPARRLWVLTFAGPCGGGA